MITPRHLEVPADVRVDARLDALDPRAGNSQRNLVLALTGRRAGVTANTFAVVNDEAVVHDRFPVVDLRRSRNQDRDRRLPAYGYSGSA